MRDKRQINKFSLKMYTQRTFDGNPQFWPKFTRYMLKTDVEFVTKVTSDNHVKKKLGSGKFSKNYREKLPYL